jgi:hypothetical protein
VWYVSTVVNQFIAYKHFLWRILLLSFSSSMELILILWSGYRVSKIDTSWFWFFRSLYKINLFLISSLNIWFFEIDFHVFFFTFLYVELSQFYSHGYGIHRLTWVNYDFFSLFFLVSSLNIFFYWESLLFWVCFLCGRSLSHDHFHDLQGFTLVDLNIL